MAAAAGAHEGTGNDLVVPLHSRRRQRGLLAQKLQHVIAGAGLFFSGMQSLSAGAHGLELALAIAGMITAGLLIAAFARAVRGVARARGTHAHPPHHHHAVDWIDIFAAGMLFAEAAEKYHLRGHIWRPETLAAVATLAIGLLHGKLAARNEQRRSMRLTGDHLVIGGRNKFVRRFTARWDEIAEIRIGDREAAIRTHTGKTRTLNLADLENAPDVRAALTRAQERLTAPARGPLTS
jgi:hypothetical protein